MSVQVCWPHLPPKTHLRSKCKCGKSLGSGQLPKLLGALMCIGNLCWGVTVWTWGAFEPYGQNGPVSARLRAPAPARMWLKVKLHRGGFPCILPNSPQAVLHKVTSGTYADASLNGPRRPFSPMVKTGLWLHVCLRKLPPTCDLRSNGIAGDSLASPRLPASRSALRYIGNLCWRVPKWTWGAFDPYGQDGPLSARLRASPLTHMWFEVKPHRGEVPGIPPTPRNTQ